MQIHSESYVATEEIGRKLGKNLKGGEIIELISDLGGGKTTLVRGIARGAGSTDKVSSPTFTVSKEYQASKLRIAHYDFYRLNDPGILAHELAETLEDKTTVVIIEWADIVADILPTDRLTIHIQTKGESDRLLEITTTQVTKYMTAGLTI